MSQYPEKNSNSEQLRLVNILGLHLSLQSVSVNRFMFCDNHKSKLHSNRVVQWIGVDK